MIELLKKRIKVEYAYDATTFTGEQLTALDLNDSDQKQSSSMAKAREHIETLERIQQAEKVEHEEMLFTIEQWRAALKDESNEDQGKQLHKPATFVEGLG